MTQNQRIVFLFDVDNTLLDTDRAQHDYRDASSPGTSPFWAAWPDVAKVVGAPAAQ